MALTGDATMNAHEMHHDSYDFSGQTGTSTEGFIKELPEGVLEIAAPFQDLNAVRIEPTDGCFVYRYVGPVETTYLPLRSKRGNPICTREPGATG